MLKKYPEAHMYSHMPLELVAADSGDPEQASPPTESPLQCTVESAPSAQCMIVVVKHCRVCTDRPVLECDDWMSAWPAAQTPFVRAYTPR